MPVRRGEPANAPSIVDRDHTRGHSALLLDPLADLLGTDLCLTEPRRLFSHPEGEDRLPIAVCHRADHHQASLVDLNQPARRRSIDPRSPATAAPPLVPA